MDVNGASQAVFNTTELLEEILERLPVKRVFAIQRVNRQFNAVVKGSLPIHQKLFLRTLGETLEKWIIRNVFIGGDWDRHDSYFLPTTHPSAGDNIVQNGRRIRTSKCREILSSRSIHYARGIRD